MKQYSASAVEYTVNDQNCAEQPALTDSGAQEAQLPCPVSTSQVPEEASASASNTVEQVSSIEDVHLALTVSR